MKLPQDLFALGCNATDIEIETIVRDCALAAYRKDFEASGDEEFANEIEEFILNRYGLESK